MLSRSTQADINHPLTRFLPITCSWLLYHQGQCTVSFQPVTALQADINHLLTRFVPGMRGWLMDLVDTWAALPPGAASSRAFVLYGGPGVGKSTFSAALCRHKPGLVQAYHFAKFSDASRRR